MDDEFKVLDELITGRVDPHIYAFKIPQIPDAIKIGDTTRPVGQRLEEWKIKYPGLESIKSWPARVDGTDYYFRDYSVHEYITETLHKQRVGRERFKVIPYSEEFFKNTSVEDIRKALDDIADNLNNHNGVRYKFYNIYDSSAQNLTYERNKTFPLRDNQKEVVERFDKAVKDGRTNLLMYAAMRFGKSFTAMNCALKMDAKLVVIVSGKADVKDEWKRTIEEHIYFIDYEFLDTDNLKEENIINKTLDSGKKVALFLTLQDIEGDEIKERHKQLFTNDSIDLLIVDETHFGARAEEMSKGINDDFVDIDEAESAIKVLKRKVTLHLSGTPYQILMGDEFKNEEDIIATCQFSDIMEAQEQWNISNIRQDCPKDDWENPYYGFPTMIRFAFNPPESTIEALRQLGSNGLTYKFSSLFSVNKGKKTFVYENEVLNLLKIIDGSKHDNSVFSFLNYEKIKNGNMCRHMVFVLPSRAACDALEILIKNHKSKFINLNSYTVINISGTKIPNELNTTEKVKSKISNYEKQNQKTITLTVKRMLTGSTIPEWDTMVFLKDTESPQEYDQAIYRIQNQYIKTLKSINADEANGGNDTYKINMKEQTLLVDFDPNRMFRIQERRSLLYNIIGKKERGNTDLEENIKKDLKYSPIIQYNANKLVQVEAQNVIDAVRNYNNDRGIREEVNDIPVDLSILKNVTLRDCISRENEIGSKNGISISTNNRNESSPTQSDLNLAFNNEDEGVTNALSNDLEKSKNKINEQKIWINKIKSYYAKILLYSFLTCDEVKSLSDVVNSVVPGTDNQEICDHIGLTSFDLNLLQKLLIKYNPLLLHNLDNKIHDMNSLSKTTDTSDEEKVEIAIKKFGRLDDAVVMTPSKTCDGMVNLLPDSVFENLDDSHKLLEIASTAGEFAAALKRRMTKMGISEKIIEDSIYVIPKNSLCYELIKKVYRYLKLDVRNIARFTAEELLNSCSYKEKDKVMYSYDIACDYLKQNATFENIILGKLFKEDTKMIEFNAVVGNPPYQVTIGQTEAQNQSNSDYIYFHFQNIADLLGKYTCLIYPFGGWFDSPSAFNGFGKKLLKDYHTISISAFEGTTDRRVWCRNDKEPNPIFSNDANLSAGVSIVLRDHTQERESFYFSNRVYSDDVVEISDKDVNYICPNPAFVQINKKIIKKSEELRETKLKNQIKKGIFGIESNFVELHKEKVSMNEQDWENPVLLYTNDKSGSSGRCKRYWIDKKNIPSGSEYFDYYKVLMISAYPKKTILTGGASISNIKRRFNDIIEILPKNSAFGASRLALFMSKDKNEIDNFIKYMNTDFFDGLIIQEPNRRSTIGSIIPAQDYSESSDIDWSKSIEDIDNQLYAKYGINSDERKFIEQCK